MVLRILDRYLLKELLATFLAVLVVLLLITFGTETTKLLRLAVEGKIPASLVFEVLFLKMPGVLEVVLPLVALLGVILAVGRLYQDHEMVVMNSCGISPRYFQKLVFWFLLPIALLTAWVTLFVAPWSYEKQQTMIMEAQTSAPFAGLSAGKFNVLPAKKGVLYARKIESNGTMLDIWMQYQTDDRQLVLMAPVGRFEWINEKLALVLENGKSYQGLSRNETSLTVQSFERFEGYLPELEMSSSKRDRESGVSTLTLLQSDALADQVLLQWRILPAISVIVLGLIGLKLSKTEPRQGRFAKLFIAIVLFIVYNQLLIVLRKSALNETIPLEIALWPIPILFLIYALWLPRTKKSKPKLNRPSEVA